MASEPELFYILAMLNFDGQQTIVDVESFASPNFRLVSKILAWFARIIRDDNLIQPPDDTSSQEEEIQFLIGVGRFFIQELGVQLNLPALYEANANSCPELLKIAQPIFEASKLFASGRLVGDDEKISSLLEESSRQVERTRKQLINDLLFLNPISQTNKLSGTVSSEGNDEKDGAEMALRDTATALKDREPSNGSSSSNNTNLISVQKRSPSHHDDQLTLRLATLASDLELLLGEEERLARERLGVMDRGYDLDQIQQVLSDSFQDILAKTKELRDLNKGLELDLLRLDERVQLKEMEIEESKQRLNELLVESPSYHREYERLKSIYEDIYDGYVARYRCFSYLKWSLYSSKCDPDIDHLISKAESNTTLPGYTSEVDDRIERQITARDQLEPDPAARVLPETVGPARLLESLAGASNPRSTSLSGTVSAGAAATTGRTRAAVDEPEAAGASGRLARYAGDDRAGLELAGLLNEFVADSEFPGFGGNDPDGEIEP